MDPTYRTLAKGERRAPIQEEEEVGRVSQTQIVSSLGPGTRDAKADARRPRPKARYRIVFAREIQSLLHHRFLVFSFGLCLQLLREFVRIALRDRGEVMVLKLVLWTLLVYIIEVMSERGGIQALHVPSYKGGGMAILKWVNSASTPIQRPCARLTRPASITALSVGTCLTATIRSRLLESGK